MRSTGRNDVPTFANVSQLLPRKLWMQMVSPEKDGIVKDAGSNPAQEELARHFTDFLKLQFFVLL